VNPGKFCAECGATLAAKKAFCSNCGQEMAAGAKFCAECGTKTGSERVGVTAARVLPSWVPGPGAAVLGAGLTDQRRLCSAKGGVDGAGLGACALRPRPLPTRSPARCYTKAALGRGRTTTAR